MLILQGSNRKQTIKPTLNSPLVRATADVRGKEVQSEAELVAAAQAGDRFAFECLMMPLQSRMLRWLTRLSGDRAIAEEILQESLFKAFIALSGFRGESSFSTWLSHIARNTYRAWRKAQALRPDQVVLEEDTATAADQLTDWPIQAESPETRIWQQELQEALHSAMAGLPEAWRQALTLREEEGLSYDDIARIQKVPLGTVRSRIHRARESLAKTLYHLMEPA